MIIATDFDGVLCEKRWPSIGAPNKKLIKKLADLKQEGHVIILWTCRTDDPFIDDTGKTRNLLDEAVRFCDAYGLTFSYINEPDPDSVAMYGRNPRKIYANIYIDDQNAGAEFMKRYGIPFTNGLTYQEKIL